MPGPADARRYGMSPPRRFRRLAAVAAVPLGAAALTLALLPSFGQHGLLPTVRTSVSMALLPVGRQQSTPAISVSCPAAAALGRHTRATLEFTLPAGYTLTRVPGLHVTDAAGKRIELLPCAL